MSSPVVRGLKITAFVVISLLLVLALIVGGLWWWAGTQSSLDWAVRQAAKSQKLEANGLQGSLRGGLRAQQLRWERDGLIVQASDAELAWDPLALMRSTIKVEYLRASRLRIEDHRPPKPSAAPVSLELPLRVEIGELRIGQVQWAAAANNFEATDLAGRYTYDLTQHHVEVANLRFAGGSYSGQATLGAKAPMPLDAKLQGRFATKVPGSTASLPLTFTASIEGPLADMRARAEVRGQPDSPTANTSATATAHVTPWGPQPVPQAEAQFRQLDAGALWPQAPHTVLSGTASVQPAGTGTWAISIDAANADPGPWDERKFPVEKLVGSGEWRTGGQAVVRELHARIGGGELTASGQAQGAQSWSVKGRLVRIDPAAVYSGMAHLPLSGTASAQGGPSAVDFMVDLQAAGGRKRGKRSGDVAQAVEALELRSAKAKGRWADGTLSLPAVDVRMADASLRGNVDVHVPSRAGRGHLTLAAPALAVIADGSISDTQGAGRLHVTTTNMPEALAWLSRWPGLPDDLGEKVEAGRGEATVTWQGGWRDPAVDATMSAQQVQLPGATPAWMVREASATVTGRLSDAQVQFRARAEQGQRRVNLEAAGQGGRRGTQASSPWQGQLSSLVATVTDPAFGKGPWSLTLQQPFDWRWAQARFDAGAGRALLKSPRDDAPAQLAWDAVRWGGGELHTAGRLTGLPLAWVELVGGAQVAGSTVTGDMVFDAQWDAQLGATPRIRASLARSRGDLTVLAENAEGQTARVTAGVREARVDIEGSGEALTATLRWDSERGGSADGRIRTRLARGGGAGWQWPEDAPLAGSLHARLPRIGVWSLLAPPGWRLRGSLVADVDVAGTRADPQLTGTLAADDLALRSVVDGIEMQNGRLRARFAGQRVLIDEFTLHGPGRDGGTLTATGEGSLGPSGPQARMSAELQKMRASIRSDRQLTVSGTVAARRDASGTVVNGNLRVDQALIILPDQSTPKLSEDVVVRGAAGPITRTQARAAEQAAKPASQQVQLSVDVDLGNDFRVQGAGIDTRLRGTVTVSGQSITSPRLVGTIRARGGEYRAYGQRLDIERGIIRFNGPPENPSLDILAVRPNITQRVGVQVTGTAFVPVVRLYSEPDLPDAEKLAWLITGRPAPATGAESALVQQAALALLASRSGSKRSVASTLGLDELSFRREGAEGPSVTLGKRFSRDFYAAYERSLSGALGTLYIFYDVSRRLTLRAQAGERTAVDLIYTFAFD